MASMSLQARCGAVGVAGSLIMLACGGSLSGPGAGAPAGSATFDGQTIEFTTVRNASGAFRRPPNPAWPRGLLDLSLANCGRPPTLIMALYDGNPAPGRYDVGRTQGEGVEASLQSPTEAAWVASPNHRDSSGSITVTSASATRIAGSFAFVLVQPRTGVIIGVPPPLPTKTIEGTFDLAFGTGVVC